MLRELSKTLLNLCRSSMLVMDIRGSWNKGGNAPLLPAAQLVVE